MKSSVPPGGSGWVKLTRLAPTTGVLRRRPTRYRQVDFITLQLRSYTVSAVGGICLALLVAGFVERI